MKIIYLGPSGYGINRTGLLKEWLVKPPCKQADIINDIQQYRPEKICIVDGLYKTIPSPWHKELLLALENHITLDGVGSLGALRAAELDDFGMKGHGWVYNFIKENEPIDDSIVALLHMDSRNYYKPITLAKIELIYIFINHSSISKLSNKMDKIQELMNQIMHVNFEKFSKNYSANILSTLDGKVDWLKKIQGDDYSIKQLDTIKYLEKEQISKTIQKKDIRVANKIERTNYIFRQKHLDLDTNNSGDLSDLNYSFQLYCSYYYPALYDLFALETHFILLCRLLSEVKSLSTSANGLRLSAIENYYNVNTWKKDSLGLNEINHEYYSELNRELLSEYPNTVFDLEDNEWLMYHNLYSALEIYGNGKNIDTKTEKKTRKVFIECLILAAIYEDVNNGYSEFFVYQNSANELNEKYRIICGMHRSFLELVKCSILMASHAGIAIQQKLKNTPEIFGDYENTINTKGRDKPFALYADTYSQEKRKDILKMIQKRNITRFFEVRPNHCIGSHLYNFHHWILLIEELTNV